MKQLFAKIFVSKKRKELLNDFVELLVEVPKVNSVEECMEGYKKIAEFNKRLNNKKKDLALKHYMHKLLEYLLDTKTHIQNGWHKPSHNGWYTKTTYPDINDYVDFGVKLKSF